MGQMDYSKPLSTLLRESTHDIHEKLSQSAGAQRLLNGRFSTRDYAQYLMILWHVHNALENGLERHATYATLEPTYNPTLLARTPSISSDICHYLQVDDWQTHPLHKNLLSILSSSGKQLGVYIDRINFVANQEDPSLLLAYSYLSYMGNLSGGQVARHHIAKAYGLDETSKSGIALYAYKELTSSKPASLGEMKRIKEWFRAGMDTAGNRGGEKLKADILEETFRAYEYNANLFDFLDLLLKDESSTLKTKGFPLYQVIAFIIAVCFSHFILVIGGFTGQAGFQKWLTVEQWMRSLW